MKSKLYTRRFLIGLISIFGLHLLLLSTGIFHLPLTSIFAVDAFLLVLFVLGTLIIAPGLDKSPDNFVNRFLVLTTFQLLVAMFAILVIAVGHIQHTKALGFHLLAVFLCLMTFQSVLLVKTIKK